MISVGLDVAKMRDETRGVREPNANKTARYGQPVKGRAQ